MKRLILLSFILLKFSVQSQTCTLTASKNPVCIGDTVWLFASNSFSATNFSWVGPNGFTSMNDTAKIVINTTSYSGTYQCSIGTGTTSSCMAAINLTVNPIPYFNIFYSVPNFCKTTCVSFLCNSMTTMQSYSWDFGNGSYSSVGPSANTCYTINGTYTISLAAMDIYGCKASNSTTVSINTSNAFFANFTYTIGNNGLVYFTDKSAGTISTWNWYFGGTANQSNSQNPTFIFADTTLSYNVCLVVKNNSNCTDTICKTISFNTAIGINELQNESALKTYPNPVNDYLYLNGMDLPFNIEIYNVLGKLIRKEYLLQPQNSINVTGIESGIYFLRLIQNNKPILTKKIIKE